MPAETPALYAKTQDLVNRQQLDLATATIKVALLKDSHVPDFENDEFLSDVTADELGVTGYTGGFGGASHQTVSLTYGFNADGEAAYQLSSPVTFPSLGGSGTEEVVQYLVAYIPGSSAADSRLVSIYKPTSEQTDGGDKSYNFPRLTQGGTGSYGVCPAQS